MRIFLSLVGILLSFLLIKYRQRLGEMIGEAQWMRSIGGVTTVIIFAAIFIFFWSLAELTGTADILLEPIKYLIPGYSPNIPTETF